MLRRRKAQTNRRRKSARQPIKQTQRQYRRHSAVQAPRIQRQTTSVSKSLIARLLAVSGAFLFVGWLLAFGWMQDRPQLHGDTSPRLEQAASAYMEEVTNFRLSLSEESYVNYLMSVLPEYESITVDVPLFDNTVVVTAMRKPTAFIWQANGRRYDMTSDGIILSQQASSRAAPLLTIIDNSTLDYEPGNRVSTNEFLRFMTRLDATLTGEYAATSLRIDGSPQFVVVTLKNYPFNLRLSPDIQPKAQVETARDLINMLNEQGRAFPREYIDTRITGRVFWQ